MDDRGFGRHDRVAALLRRELAQLIQQSVKDPRLGSVTVTDVEVTRDLSLARVYVASADASTLEDSLKALTSAGGYLRRTLGRMLTLRSVPTLRFLGDDSAQRGDHIDSLLREVLPEAGDADTRSLADSEAESEEPDSHQPDPSPAAPLT